MDTEKLFRPNGASHMDIVKKFAAANRLPRSLASDLHFNIDLLREWLMLMPHEAPAEIIYYY